MTEIVVFDIWGDYAQFKKNYTTTSPISYGIPPRSTVAGLIAAIVGLGRREYYQYFSLDKAWISVRVLSPIKRIQITESFINTKDGFVIPVKKKGHEPRILVRIDFVKDPKYRIYLVHKDTNLVKKLIELLSEHKCVYTPYFGISELIANFQFVGTFTAEKIKTSEDVPINSIVPFDALEQGSVKIAPAQSIAIENMPLYINENRVAEKYSKIVYDENGEPLMVKPKSHYWRLENGENIMFFSGA